jgi:phosphoribosylformimino-5-aminoimidazole carboxamide ribotide isomerase
MEVIPSIDLKSGRCVRLYQGDYQRETVYSEDPLAVAQSWQDQGAPRLHLVDLDGAAAGTPVNLDTVSNIIDRLTIPVQVGGGIRDQQTAQRLLDSGAHRVVIGTAAVEDPLLVRQLCQKYGSHRVVVAVDAREGQVAIKGWTEKTTVTTLDLAKQMSLLGVTRILYTDIHRDGTLTEPNFAANATLVKETGLAVLASGGITSLNHIRGLAQTGVEGVVVGSALYTGTISLPDALAAVTADGSGDR